MEEVEERGYGGKLRGMKGGETMIVINCLRKESAFNKSKPPSSVAEGVRLLALAESVRSL